MRFKLCILLAFLFISCQNLNGEYMSPEINEFPVIEGNNLAWHYDAANSDLHMGISIRGKRTLFAIDG